MQRRPLYLIMPRSVGVDGADAMTILVLPPIPYESSLAQMSAYFPQNVHIVRLEVVVSCAWCRTGRCMRKIRCITSNLVEVNTIER